MNQREAAVLIVNTPHKHSPLTVDMARAVLALWSLRSVLKRILPLAKGYAAEHQGDILRRFGEGPVGHNQKIVDEAMSILAVAEKELG